MTYSEALVRLEAHGFHVMQRPFGVEGFCETAEGRLRFQIGRSSGVGDELSIRREGQGASLPGGPVRWFQRPTLEELIALLVEAQLRVHAGNATSLFEALRDLDPPQE